MGRNIAKTSQTDARKLSRSLLPDQKHKKHRDTKQSIIIYIKSLNLSLTKFDSSFDSNIILLVILYMHYRKDCQYATNSWSNNIYLTVVTFYAWYYSWNVLCSWYKRLVDDFVFFISHMKCSEILLLNYFDWYTNEVKKQMSSQVRTAVMIHHFNAWSKKNRSLHLEWYVQK